MSAGYSETPLAKKLGIKEGYRVLLYNQPTHYFLLFSDLPKRIELFDSINDSEADFIHLFFKTQKELLDISEKYKKVLNKNGLLWVSWPKGSSKISTDLKRDFIRNYLLEIGLVDVKVCAIDDDWSGLKFVYRLKDR